MTCPACTSLSFLIAGYLKLHPEVLTFSSNRIADFFNLFPHSNITTFICRHYIFVDFVIIVLHYALVAGIFDTGASFGLKIILTYYD